MICLLKERIALKKQAIRSKKIVFVICFSPFYAQERIAPDVLYPVALFKRATGAIRSCRSLQNSDRE